MNQSLFRAALALPVVGLLALATPACSPDDGTNPNAPQDSGAIDSARDTTPSSDTGLGGDSPTTTDADGGTLALKPFTAPPTDPGAKAILFAASGEALALGGYAFPPATAGAPAFVDGWEVKFTRLIVTIDKITLSENPDKVPTDPSKTDGVVAEADGPWAVDLHKGGPLVGKGGAGERSVPIAAIANQNKAGGAAFDTTKRYALGFDAIAATKDAQNVNLDADGLADYQEMIAKGYAVFYAGTATFKGGTTCTSPTPTSAYDFSKLPKVVSFKLGFKSPTTYVNCQNADNDPAAPFAGEEHQRGIQVDPTKFVVGQVTYHSDHPFWESVEHDAPAHFDMLAARKIGTDPATITMDDVVGVDPTNLKDKNGTGLPWRTCVATYTAGTGTMAFDPKSVPVDPSKTPDRALRDLADFMTYNQSTQGHLNSDGLCYVRHNYPSP